jgi:hypothetical protein
MPDVSTTGEEAVPNAGQETIPGWRLSLPVCPAPDVFEGLVDQVGDTGLVEGGHDVDRRADLVRPA